MIYFNENDAFASQWLRNLYPESTVDERDIQQVAAADIAGFRRCHFFGGIGGWEYALELAGWPAEWPVWTGSCPCQPLSSAGRRLGEKDKRHLWPEFYGLISEHRPAIIFGEQVASTDGLEWIDGISLDLEELGYAIGTSDLPAASKGAPQKRQRFFWAAICQLGGTDRARFGERRAIERQSLKPMPSARSNVSRLGDTANYGTSADEQAWQLETKRHGTPGGVGIANGPGSQSGQQARAASRHWHTVVAAGSDGRLGDTGGDRMETGQAAIAEESWTQTGRATAFELSSAWDDFTVIPCGDDRSRRASAQPGDEPLAYGIPRDLGLRFPELRQVAKSARANRVGRLRGYGNAIVPQLAAVFIRCAMEAMEATCQP